MSTRQSIFFLSSKHPTTVRLESNPPHPKSAILGLSWSYPRPHPGKSSQTRKGKKYFALHSLQVWSNIWIVIPNNRQLWSDMVLTQYSSIQVLKESPPKCDIIPIRLASTPTYGVPTSPHISSMVCYGLDSITQSPRPQLLKTSPPKTDIILIRVDVIPNYGLLTFWWDASMVYYLQGVTHLLITQVLRYFIISLKYLKFIYWTSRNLTQTLRVSRISSTGG